MNPMKRLKEPSTWAGFAVCLEVLKFVLPQYAAVIVGAQGVLGGVAVVMRESLGGAVVVGADVPVAVIVTGGAMVNPEVAGGP